MCIKVHLSFTRSLVQTTHLSAVSRIMWRICSSLMYACVQLSPLWELSICSVNQEIPSLILETEVNITCSQELANFPKFLPCLFSPQKHIVFLWGIFSLLSFFVAKFNRVSATRLFHFQNHSTDLHEVWSGRYSFEDHAKGAVSCS